MNQLPTAHGLPTNYKTRALRNPTTAIDLEIIRQNIEALKSVLNGDENV